MYRIAQISTNCHPKIHITVHGKPQQWSRTILPYCHTLRCLYTASGGSSSFNVVLMGLAVWEVTTKAIDWVRFETCELSSSRMEMRLLSDTRSVLEYLPTFSVSICRWKGLGWVAKGQMSHNFPRTAILRRRTPRSKIVRFSSTELRSTILRAYIPVVILDQNCVGS